VIGITSDDGSTLARISAESAIDKVTPGADAEGETPAGSWTCAHDAVGSEATYDGSGPTPASSPVDIPVAVS